MRKETNIFPQEFYKFALTKIAVHDTLRVWYYTIMLAQGRRVRCAVS